MGKGMGMRNRGGRQNFRMMRPVGRGDNPYFPVM